MLLYFSVTRSVVLFENPQEKIDPENEYNACPYAALTIVSMRLCQQSQTLV